jgi:hypothetical protein
MAQLAHRGMTPATMPKFPVEVTANFRSHR